MTELTANVSLKKKAELCKGLLLIAQSADYFKDDKKLLKSLAAALKNQKKACANSVYPMTETDKSEVFLLISDLGEIVLKLAKVKKVSDFQVWNGRLINFVSNLTNKLDAMTRELKIIDGETVSTKVKKAIDNVVETVKKNLKGQD